MEETKLLEVENLKTYFYHDEGVVKAVDDISFNINAGKTLGVVGESGCGKSVTSLSIMNLVPQPRGRIVGGKIKYYQENGMIDLSTLNPRGKEIRKIRGNEISMIFQEPMRSLNPVHTVGEQIMESLRLHRGLNNEQAKKKAIEMLDLVGIALPANRVNEYPHELSGGMRQRVMIAMALSCDPNLLIADEPTTALDVTIEAQILNLMEELQQRLNMAIMFITHDIDVIGEMADEVIVMYCGKIVERAKIRDIFHNPKHPYTRGLLNSIPKIGAGKRLIPIDGSVPDLKSLPTGCYFSTRCPEVMDVCYDEDAPEVNFENKQSAKCWLYDKYREELSYE